MITSDIVLSAQDPFWESTLIAVPGSTSVLVTLPSRGARSPWCSVDVSTGEIRRGKGMPGSLRAVLFADDDPHWGLSTYGVVRLRLGSRLEVADVFRKGIGKYLRTLVDFDDDLLAVGEGSRSSLLLVSKVDGSAVQRIKMAGPELAYLLPDGRLRVLGFHHAEATDVDITRRKVIARHPLPHGKGALHVDNRVIVLSGRRYNFDIGDDEPDTIVVLENEDVSGEIIVLDASTLEILQRAPLPGGCVEVLGVDTAGRVVVSTHSGFLLLDPQTLAVTATYESGQEIGGAVHVPEHDVVCVLGETSLHVVRC